MTGEQIRGCRKQMGLTQVQLGEALGVSGNTIARWERNEVPPDNPKMLALAFDQLVLERVSIFKGPLGKKAKKHLKMLERNKAELERLVAQQPVNL